MNINDLIRKLAQQETEARETPFLSPCVAGGRVRARIGGIVQTFRVVPENWAGWGIFLAMDGKTAELYEDAELLLIERYLRGLKPLKLRLVQQMKGQTWLGYPVNESDAMQKFGSARPVIVHLVEGGSLFEAISARHDGSAFWFEEMDRRADPVHADKLREAFENLTLPEDVQFANLTPEMRIALEIAAGQSDRYKVRYPERFARRVTEEAEDASSDSLSATWRRTQNEGAQEARLRRALETGGGSLRAYTDHGTHWTVEWTDRRGVRQTSAITKDDLTVVSSGICLSGQDRNFDLQSLVGVMEGWEGDW
jgi:hypothetical protein